MTVKLQNGLFFLLLLVLIIIINQNDAALLFLVVVVVVVFINSAGMLSVRRWKNLLGPLARTSILQIVIDWWWEW